MDIIKARIDRLCNCAIMLEYAQVQDKHGNIHRGQLLHYRTKAGEALQFTILYNNGTQGIVDVDHTNALSCYVL